MAGVYFDANNCVDADNDKAALHSRLRHGYTTVHLRLRGGSQHRVFELGPRGSARYLVFFDGGSRGNPGPGGSGSAVIKVDEGVVGHEICWPDDELNDLRPRRVADTQREFPLKEDPIAEKTQRAGKPKAWLGGKEFEAQRDSTDTTAPVKCPPAESTRYPFKEGSHVWLTMKRVKPRVKMKLVRHWRRPFGVKKTVDEHYKKRETRLQLVQVADES
ncbi:hypothetical protein ON010_g3405 [Phytophthora cinnamomi]|nr:hypothetical protein ON010_g3405 [Phytophthora cinnamomi]